MSREEKLVELEQLRRGKRNSNSSLLIVVFFALFIITLIPLGYLFLFVLFMFYGRSRKKDVDYQNAVKDYFVKEVLSEYYSDIVFVPKVGFSASQINSGGVIDVGRSFTSNDLIQGSYKGMFFQQSDISISVKTSRGKRQVFKGQWLVVDLLKNMDGFLRIHGTKNKRNTSILNEKGLGKLRHIKLESDDFNSTFTVEATSDVEGYYFLTPHLMEKLVALEENTIYGIIVAYHNQKLHIGLNSLLDLYEPNTREPLDEKYFNQIRWEIERINSILDEFI